MTTAEGRPVLEAPTGGTVSQPTNPSQWHGHPFVWAWNVALGATSPAYIERECAAAERDEAPPDAVYKTRDDDPSMPGQWVTVGMLTNADQQQRVREYAAALGDWSNALEEHRKRPAVQALHEVKQTQEPEEFEYTVTFNARLTGVVKAASMLEATKKMTPGEKFAPSGYGVLDLSGERGVVWHAAFDSGKGTVVTTTDPRIPEEGQPEPLPGPELTSPKDVGKVGSASLPMPPSLGRGVILGKRNKQ
ncbi:hypothetical protein ACWDFH_19320 [Streptomyces kronopolitis]